MPTITVVGGAGVLAAPGVECLAKTPGVTVRVLSRSSSPRLDVTDPSTFAALDGSDLVLNVSNATAAPPDAMAVYCLERGLTMLEATSDRAVIARLAKLDASKANGRLVLGAGIFTGLSNLLAREAVRRTPQPRALRLTIATSPYSAAGQGTIDLMISALNLDAIAVKAGSVVSQPLALGPRVSFAQGSSATVTGALAEQAMLPASTGLSEVEVLLAPQPGFVAQLFGHLPKWLLRQAWFRAMLRLNFTVLRRWLLGWRSTGVDLLAEVEGPTGTTRLQLSTSEGMRAGGIALAAIALELLEHAGPPGVYFIDQRIGLGATLSRLNAFAPDLVRMQAL